MGARTDAARSEVLAARAGLDEEIVRLEAAGSRRGRHPGTPPARAGEGARAPRAGPRSCCSAARSGSSRASAARSSGRGADLPEVDAPAGGREDAQEARARTARRSAARSSASSPSTSTRRRRSGASATSARRRRSCSAAALKPVPSGSGGSSPSGRSTRIGPSFAEGMRRARAPARTATQAAPPGRQRTTPALDTGTIRAAR